jgi:hypothetical protein
MVVSSMLCVVEEEGAGGRGPPVRGRAGARERGCGAADKRGRVAVRERRAQRGSACWWARVGQEVRERARAGGGVIEDAAQSSVRYDNLIEWRSRR